MCVSMTPWDRTLTKTQAKFIKSLRLKKHRQQHQAFVVEGAQNVHAALSSKFAVQMVAGTPSFLQRVSPHALTSAAFFYAATEQTLAGLGTLRTNSTALAVVRIPPATRLPSTGLILALDNLQDPGNLGTIIRTADWYAISDIVCSLHTVELYNPKVLRASMGSFANVSVHYTDLPSYLRQVGVPVVGAVLDTDASSELNLSAPGVLVIGNEAQGISSAVSTCLQERVTIPRLGRAGSLNAAVATAILCDRWRQRCTGAV